MDGELLAVPLVPAGILMVVRATRATEPTERWGGMLAAGALAASAALVKQNMVDVVVFVVVSLAFTAVRRGVARRQPCSLAGFAGGAAATAGLALWLVSMRGTSPSSLWDALVTFRAQAAAVIDANATDATPDRMRLLLLALLLTGAPLVVGVSLAASGRRRHGAAVRTDPAPGLACAGVAPSWCGANTLSQRRLGVHPDQRHLDHRRAGLPGVGPVRGQPGPAIDVGVSVSRVGGAARPRR